MIFRAGLLLLVTALLDGCAQSGTPAPIGMPNPASTYCIQLGGQLDIKSAPQGQYGVCTLPSGAQIEEWTLYRRDHPAT